MKQRNQKNKGKQTVHKKQNFKWNFKNLKNYKRSKLNDQRTKNQKLRP